MEILLAFRRKIVYAEKSYNYWKKESHFMWREKKSHEGTGST